MMASMDSQFIANLISGISALATVVAAIYTRRQAIGSKEAKAKAEESHKAALDMRDAAQRSAKAAEEQANQAELARKAAEERVRQAEKLLEQMQQIVAEQQSQSQSQSKIADSLYRPTLELTHIVKNQHPNNYHYMLRNISGNPVTVLEVENLDEFITSDCDIPDLPATVHPGSPLRLHLPHTGKAESLELRINDSGQEKTLYVEFPR